MRERAANAVALNSRPLGGSALFLWGKSARGHEIKWAQGAMRERVKTDSNKIAKLTKQESDTTYMYSHTTNFPKYFPATLSTIPHL
jgi:hypothetical protein